MYADRVQELLDAAARDGLTLHLASGLRTQDEQIALRRDYVIDKSRAGDMTWIMIADSSNFKPVTGRPGYSNHQNGRAIDISVMDAHQAAQAKIDQLDADRKAGKVNDVDYLAQHATICATDPYRWLVKNALAHGFVRTVATQYDTHGNQIAEGERWHWEWRADQGINDMFHYVQKTDPTWDSLI